MRKRFQTILISAAAGVSLAGGVHRAEAGNVQGGSNNDFVESKRKRDPVGPCFILQILHILLAGG
jgi:hypothetical protein